MLILFFNIYLTNHLSVAVPAESFDYYYPRQLIKVLALRFDLQPLYNHYLTFIIYNKEENDNFPLSSNFLFKNNVIYFFTCIFLSFN